MKYQKMKKRGKCPMLIFIVLFMVASYVTTSFLVTVFANTAAIYSILSIVLFGGIGLMFLKEARRIGTTIFLAAVLLMVAVQGLAPYKDILIKCVAAILAIVGLVLLKRPMLRFVRNDERSQNPFLPVWARWVMRLI